MKKMDFVWLGLITILFTVSASAQKKNADRHSSVNPISYRGEKVIPINYEKIRSVALEKTDALDKIVQLDEKKQKKQVYKIYESHELSTQKEIREKSKKNTRYNEKPKYYKEDKQGKTVDNKILKILKGKQKKLFLQSKQIEEAKILQ